MGSPMTTVTGLHEFNPSAAEPGPGDRTAHPADSASACSSTVRVADSCLSGGQPCRRRPHRLEERHLVANAKRLLVWIGRTCHAR